MQLVHAQLELLIAACACVLPDNNAAVLWCVCMVFGHHDCSVANGGGKDFRDGTFVPFE
jgi:hypothetical protein